jgi:hypothetical protein
MFCKVKVAPQKAVLGRKLEIPKYFENVQAQSSHGSLISRREVDIKNRERGIEEGSIISREKVNYLQISLKEDMPLSPEAASKFFFYKDVRSSRIRHRDMGVSQTLTGKLWLQQVAIDTSGCRLHPCFLEQNNITCRG